MWEEDTGFGGVLEGGGDSEVKEQRRAIVYHCSFAADSSLR